MHLMSCMALVYSSTVVADRGGYTGRSLVVSTISSFTRKMTTIPIYDNLYNRGLSTRECDITKQHIKNTLMYSREF